MILKNIKANAGTDIKGMPYDIEIKRANEGTDHGQNHKYHWNGSTDTGKTLRLEDVPIDFRRKIPNGDI